jgi:hypothetical protein
LVLYMTREDETELLDHVRALGSLTILPATSPTPDFTPIGALPEPSQDESTRRFFLHYNVDGMPLVTEHMPEKNYYLIDEYQSPVIELWRSWSVSQIMMPGGIQAEMMWIDSEKQDLENKPKEFRKRFESIEGWIHKNFLRLGIHIFAGPGAIMFREDGGMLQGR